MISFLLKVLAGEHVFNTVIMFFEKYFVENCSKLCVDSCDPSPASHDNLT